MDLRRKKLLYRSQHMGTKENDALFGVFAENELEGLSEEQVAAYEQMLSASDQELYDWVLGLKVPPEDIDLALLELIRKRAGLKK